ncbi:hypothetical protein CRG98_035230 [Punica granatum]|uniref:Uncharacterized protein n=1 Tax=Punica granatum TaxID=22663 RepID=A0A2I0IK27_PUNGR|nr:hypothetical protein CRG98_035230 [Punica granatum]
MSHYSENRTTHTLDVSGWKTTNPIQPHAMDSVLVDPDSNESGSWSPVIDWTQLSQDGIEGQQSWLVSSGHGSPLAGHGWVSSTPAIVFSELDTYSNPPIPFLLSMFVSLFRTTRASIITAKSDSARFSHSGLGWAQAHSIKLQPRLADPVKV